MDSSIKSSAATETIKMINPIVCKKVTVLQKCPKLLWWQIKLGLVECKQIIPTHHFSSILYLYWHFKGKQSTGIQEKMDILIKKIN